MSLALVGLVIGWTTGPASAATLSGQSGYTMTAQPVENETQRRYAGVGGSTAAAYTVPARPATWPWHARWTCRSTTTMQATPEQWGSGSGQQGNVGGSGTSLTNVRWECMTGQTLRTLRLMDGAAINYSGGPPLHTWDERSVEKIDSDARDESTPVTTQPTSSTVTVDSEQWQPALYGLGLLVFLGSFRTVSSWTVRRD